MVQKVNDKLFTMPQSYYGAAPDVSGASSFRPTVSSGGLEPVAQHKNRSLLIILGLGVLVLLALAGWLVYLNYQPVNLPVAGNVPATIPAQPTEPVVTTPPVETPPVVSTTPEMSEPATVETPESAVVEPVVEAPVPSTSLASKSLSDYTMTDEDSDGLTDAEELLIGTKVDTADSDGDTYVDGTELINLYNPLAKDPASLAFSGITSTYVNPVFGYSILYPKSWVAKAVDSSNKEVMFSSAVGENVSLIAHDNPDSLDLLAWYTARSPVDADKVSTMTTKSNTLVLRSTDGFHVFAARGKIVIEMVYSVGMKDEVSYPHLFEAMVQSFVFTNQE